MQRLIFVHHPKEEPQYNIGKSGEPVDPIQIIPWNCGTHKRKLIRHDGIYVKDIDAPIDYASLYFWGEYEPYSCAHVYAGKPAIHDDLKSARNMNITPLANMRNTDPYVFGGRFKYICCKKTGKLNPGDIVLFGNYNKGSNLFYFDTVFVCKYDHSVVNNDFENQYFVASVRASGRNTVSEGVMYKDSKEMFSFVPCRIGNWDTDECEESNCFQYLDLPFLNMSRYERQTTSTRGKTIVEFESYMWTDILEAVRNANMYFGIHLAEI